MSIDAKKTWAIAISQLTKMSRDKTGLMMTLLMPFILIAILGAALNGVFKFGTIPVFPVLIVNEDIAAKPSSPEMGAFSLFLPSFRFGQILVEDVFGDKNVCDIIDADVVESVEAAKGQVKGGKAVALVHIPSDFSANVLSGKAAVIDVTTDPGKPIHSSIVNQIVSSFTDQMAHGAVTGKLLGMMEAASHSNDTSWLPKFVRTQTGARDVSAMQYYSAAMAIMFVMITGFVKGASYLREKETGTLNRLLASPTSRATILSGYLVGSVMLLSVQFGLLMAGTALLFKVYWGPWQYAILLAATFAFASTGIGMALAAIVRDSKTAENSVGLIGNIFAALSGSMMPAFLFPPILQALAKVIPNYWALTSFTDLMGDLNPNRILGPIAILAVTGLITGTFGTISFGRK